ncbi:hypothetical protein [Priestia megaterium]|uniref:hypothetical protein n=1 Tax=Priestia megaterium TaxID=1404 RepID=UPI001C236A7C|nr:hypothetical protein [Priestia megaterium]MBU8757188.1 hypothetical protein [Priestia megaterium]
MYIDPKGILGYHQDPISHLFVVVQGKGWVTGENQKQINIKAGEAAFWEKERVNNNEWKNRVGDFIFLSRRNRSPIGIST